MPDKSHYIEWNEENIQKLLKLWNTNLSASQIAKKMSITKNAVIGKVHRLRDALGERAVRAR